MSGNIQCETRLVRRRQDFIERGQWITVLKLIIRSIMNSFSRRCSVVSNTTEVVLIINPCLLATKLSLFLLLPTRTTFLSVLRKIRNMRRRKAKGHTKKNIMRKRSHYFLLSAIMEIIYTPYIQNISYKMYVWGANNSAVTSLLLLFHYSAGVLK
jgi:hypothetical protein